MQTSVTRTARLAEPTVQAAERHAADMRTARRRGRTRRPEPPLVEAAAFHPDVWAGVLAMAGGDPARVEIIRPGEVVVHNTPGWWARRVRRN